MLIPWGHRITDKEKYRYNMKVIAKHYPIDAACKDGARFFFPCKEIVSLAEDGYAQEVLHAEHAESRQYSYEPGFIPQWTRAKLLNVVPEGERTTIFHLVAKDLIRAGYKPEHILQLIVKSPTYKGEVSYHALTKLQQAIKSATTAIEKELINGRNESAAQSN